MLLKPQLQREGCAQPMLVSLTLQDDPVEVPAGPHV